MSAICTYLDRLSDVAMLGTALAIVAALDVVDLLRARRCRRG